MTTQWIINSIESAQTSINHLQSKVTKTQETISTPNSPGPGCSKAYLPVCGVDNKTYGNECAARSVGIAIAYDGECDKPFCPIPICAANTTMVVTPGEPCPIYSCNPKPPKPLPRPPVDPPPFPTPVCPKIYSPVCGSDGVSYPNSCVAENAGVAEYVVGKCPEINPRPNTPTNDNNPNNGPISNNPDGPLPGDRGGKPVGNQGNNPGPLCNK